MTEPMPPIEQKDPTEPGPSAQNPNADGGVSTQVYLPRITIKYCTQCKWMLRAAYVSDLFYLKLSVLFFYMLNRYPLVSPQRYFIIWLLIVMIHSSLGVWVFLLLSHYHIFYVLSICLASFCFPYTIVFSLPRKMAVHFRNQSPA